MLSSAKKEYSAVCQMECKHAVKRKDIKIVYEFHTKVHVFKIKGCYSLSGNNMWPRKGCHHFS
ncbi:hypothetical protein PILCRDRAFT_328415 [Piloderma croceum F 1598]|uniref:Uncharacterized protein n=1 Tax=Piloderma croceum (strain F 1598) TaxID=765440 RepID=A0A0C3C856_PILCF|nr:hypothetical protein PILCRDRAFT_328415 [Piloderma croceum F 1598]